MEALKGRESGAKIMKKILFVILTCVAAMGTSAAEKDSLLSLEHITIDGNEIALPTTQKADGTVCKSYVAEAHQDGDKLVAKIEQSCVSRPAASA